MSMKGVKIERYNGWWHVHVKYSDSNAGYIEQSKHADYKDALLMAEKIFLRKLKQGAL